MAVSKQKPPVTLFQDNYRIESARLRGWDYRSPGWYFVTICSHDRECVFGDIVDENFKASKAGEIVSRELENLPTHYSNVRLDCAVVMPNHIHMVVVIDGLHRHSPETTSGHFNFIAAVFPECSPRQGSSQQ